MNVKVHAVMSFKTIIGAREVEIEVPAAATVRELLDSMVRRWGESLSSQLFCPNSDQILGSVTLMVNGRAIRFLDGMETVLREGDEVLLLPPAAGG